ncbi:MAG: lytic transglycosylase domain-containing protein [Bdellovibrionia bacterium]
MKTILFIVVLVSGFQIHGFSTKPNPKQAEVVEALEQAPTMNTLLEKNADGFETDPKRAQIMLFVKEEPFNDSKLTPAGQILKVCETKKDYEEICKIFNENSEAKVSSTPRSSRPRISLQEKNLAELNKLDLQQSTANVGKEKLENVLKFSKFLQSKEECQTSHLYTALGSQLESGFPKEDFKQSAKEMYGKAIACAQDESAFRGAFRLGMIEVLDNNCTSAVSALEKVPKLSGLGFIHSRAQYWISHCNSKNKSETDSKEVVAANTNGTAVLERFSQYPMSFHSVLFSLERDDAVFKRVKEQIEPKIVFRTTQSDSLNLRVAFVEAFLREGKFDHARLLMTRIQPPDVTSLEPHFRLYLGFLYHRTQLPLHKFQILSQLFSEDVSFKSYSSLKIMYPLWRYEIVDNHTKTIDPLLVLSLIRQESAFQEEARSRVGARGLMQIMPRTANSIVKRKIAAEQLYDPDLNVKLGTTYLDTLLKRYDGNVFYVLAAYNAGALRVDEWRKRYPTENSLIFMDLIPYRETREYVSSILRNYYWYSHLYPEQSKRQFVFWTQLDKPEGSN